MKAIEVNKDNFDSLLAYDDLFVDYFNAFLQLPAFPQPLYYNRLTGAFQEVEDVLVGGSLQTGEHPPAMLAPIDEELERIMEWAINERLPLFMRTRLFLEYKLCKLLVRPLDNRNSAISRQSSYGLRGYSRQTTSYATSSLIRSAAPSLYDNESHLSWPDLDQTGLFKYLRPGSRCQSLPATLGLVGYYGTLSSASAVNKNKESSGDRHSSNVTPSNEVKPSHLYNTHNSSEYISQDLMNTSFDHEGFAGTSNSQEANTPNKKSSLKSPGLKGGILKKHATIQIPRETKEQDSDDEGSFSQAIDERFTSAPADKGATSPHYSTIGEFIQEIIEDEDDQPSLIEYEEDDLINCERTESELLQMVGKHYMTFQQLKEEVLGGMVGMDEFKSFLIGTAGENLLNFWLDCELYRDNVQALDNSEVKVTKSRLFRDIQDKYKFKLTKDAKDQIKKAQGNEGLSESVYTRTQYDVLRRLRMYWVPRFLIHQKRLGDFRFQRIQEVQERVQEERHQRYQVSFLPSISLVNSLPVRPGSCYRLASTANDWNMVSKAGRKMQDEVQPGCVEDLSPRSMIRPMSARFQIGLASDREAGRPFQQYLERQMDTRLLANLLFLQDVTDYGEAEERSADRFLRMSRAWHIFNKYIIDGSVWDIGLPCFKRNILHHQLLTASDFVAVTAFEKIKENAMKTLQREWLRYLRQDLKTFLKCRARIEDVITVSRSHSQASVGSPVGGVTEKKHLKSIKNQQGRHYKSTSLRDMDILEDSEESEPDTRATKIKTKSKKELSPEEKKKAAEKKKKQLAEQKKLLRKVKQREANQKKKSTHDLKGSVKFKTPQDEKKEKDNKAEEELKRTPEELTRNVTFKKVNRNRSLMNLFKSYLQDAESRERVNECNMYIDVDVYIRIPDSHGDKKISQGKMIMSNYFDPSSKRFVELSQDVMTKLSSEGNKPTAKTLELAQKAVAQKLEDSFTVFWSAHVESLEEQGVVIGGDLSKADLALRSDSSQSMMMAWKKKRRQGKGTQSGQHMPSTQDKNEFMAFLLQLSRGVPPVKMMHFHRYLIVHGEKDGFPMMANDLRFYMEAQRFKDAHNGDTELSLLKKKVEVIQDCFFDSATGSSGVQIDVSPELAAKVLRLIESFLKDRGKDPHPANLFEECQHSIFKELLPYWAGFSRRYTSTHFKDRIPSTKVERLSRERLRKYIEMEEPQKEFCLPAIAAPQSRSGGTCISFTISDGIQWKTFDYGDAISSHDDNASPNLSRRGSSLDSQTASVINEKQGRRSTIRKSSNLGSTMGDIKQRLGGTPKVNVLSQS
ncbi:uncharacterized protein LOC117107440 isoform X2 [Anneissia japonica]|uniref:uncharacterized protein LOC117107440 isoform X2 n=1 Tax=Anneissia japonica TaxID=1529436 RepID=UPI0014257C72|nr:uncharacterized protein LOC117107440 isoform X2 [Anneissia japonica]